MSNELLPNAIVKLMIYLIYAGLLFAICGFGAYIIFELPEHIFYSVFGVMCGLFLSAALTFALEPKLTRKPDDE